MQNLLIFLVDDDEDDRLLLRQAFQQHPAPTTIEEFEDGVAVVDTLKVTAYGEYPNLILLDLNMPRMNGFSALKIIKEHPDWQSIPVAVLTTSSDDQDRQKSIALGADAYMVKPPTYLMLRSIIDRGVAIAEQDASENESSH
ncbi:hypothetical protein GCM10027578_37260 [Spirosoma luteolum]